MIDNNIKNTIEFITVNIDDIDIPNANEFIADYQQIRAIEDLFDVLVKDSTTPAKELLPVAGAGLKLLTSSRGTLIRKNLLMSIIKDERIDTKDMKQLIKLVRKTFNPLKMASGLIKQNNTQVA